MHPSTATSPNSGIISGSSCNSAKSRRGSTESSRSSTRRCLPSKDFQTKTRPTIGELAHRLALRHHTTVELVNRLETAGFVARKPDPADGRQILLHLSQRGIAKLHSLSLAHIEELQVKGPELAKALRSISRRERGSNAA